MYTFEMTTADFRASTAGVYQELRLWSFECLITKVEFLSRIECSVQSQLSSNSGSDVGGYRIRSDEARSLLNSVLLMFLVRRKVNFEGGEEDVGVRLRWVEIGKWSDTVMKDCGIVGERLVWKEVITRSSVWLCMWAETETCWVRLVYDNRSVNCWDKESRASSRCMLKSPVIIDSCEVVAADEGKFGIHLEKCWWVEST